jgi:hypothetical protein
MHVGTERKTNTKTFLGRGGTWGTGGGAGWYGGGGGGHCPGIAGGSGGGGSSFAIDGATDVVMLTARGAPGDTGGQITIHFV